MRIEEQGILRRKNRKKKRLDAYLFPIPFAGLVVVVVTITMGYILLGLRCQSMASELKVLEQRHNVLRREYRQKIFKWTQMKSPKHLELALRQHGVQMTWPSIYQVLKLSRGNINNPELFYNTRKKLVQVNRSRINDY